MVRRRIKIYQFPNWDVAYPMHNKHIPSFVHVRVYKTDQVTKR
jgi:hypothetical protein